MQTDNDELDFIDKAIKPKKKSEVAANIERTTFLKAYAQEPQLPIEQIAATLTIPQKSAESYVKKYIYLMIHTANDEDNPRKVRLILNEGITNPKERISDVELNALKPLIDRYGDFDTVSTLRQKELNQTLLNKSGSMGYVSMNHDFSGAHQGFPTQPSLSEQIDKPYASLSNSGRSNLLRFVLERSPYIHNSKITPFIQLFETNEMKYMSSPDELFNFMTNYFGPAAGKLAFTQFKDMINQFLSPSQGFGQNPYAGGGGFNQFGQPQGGWGNGGQQEANYYQQLGVIPYGVNPRSPEALQAIYEFRTEQKQRKAAEAMQENIKNYVNLKMMDIVDPNKGGGAQQSNNMNNWMQMAIMSGQMKIQGIDPSTGMPILTPNDTSSNSLAVGMMNVMNQMYTGVLQAQASTPKFMESLLTAMFTKLNTQSDPFTMAISAKKLADSFSPPGGSMNGIEAAKILLARNKIESDKELTLQKMQFEHDKEMYEREKQDKQEEHSNAQTQDIVKSIFSIGGQALVPLLSMFMGRNNPGMAAALAGMQGGGGGMPGGMDIGAMMGGGGMPGAGVPGVGGMAEMMGDMGMGQPGAMPVDMSQIIGMQQNGGNPQWMDYEPNAMYGYNTNNPAPMYVPAPPTIEDQWRNFNPNHPSAMQPQPVPENTGWQNANQSAMDQLASNEQKSEFSVDDFSNDTPEAIASKIQEALQGRSGLDSFINAARIAHQQKLMEGHNVQQVPNSVDAIRNDIQNMPSNVPIEAFTPATPDDKLIQHSQRFNDELDAAEELVGAPTNDLKAIAEVPMNEPEKEKPKEKPARTAMDDLSEGDVA